MNQQIFSAPEIRRHRHRPPRLPGKQIMFEATRPVIIDCRNTTKSYLALLSLIRELGHRDPETVVELVVQDGKGMLKDVCTWCEGVGNELLNSEIGSEGELRVLIQKGTEGAMVGVGGRRASVVSRERRGSGVSVGGKGGVMVGKLEEKEKSMLVLIETSELRGCLGALERAITAAVLGWTVDVVFEAKGVKLLKRGYRAMIPGFLGKWVTNKVEKELDSEGLPLPGTSIEILEELGASFWVDGEGLRENGVREEELIVKGFTVCGGITLVDLLARSDIKIFSKDECGKS